jgi:sarcosine oxidase subunit alpha
VDSNNPERFAQGGRIARDKPVAFTFNGRQLIGYRGDSLASALIANGIKVVGRSFKYHRPRGIFSAGEEEPAALVEIGEGARREPTCRAPMVPLTPRLVANSQNCWPSVRFDVGRMLDYTHILWPAGFYNKTFKWPSWRTWENLVRHSAGMGRPLTEADPDHYEQVNAHCDLLICGAGPAGLMSALVAGQAGLRVILVDQNEELGGVLTFEQVELDGLTGFEWVRKVKAELENLPNVITLPRTVVAGNYDHNVTTLLQRGALDHVAKGTWRECFWTVRPRHVLLAAGAIEQGMIFGNNDRPGIMLAGAVRHFVNRYAVIPGRNTVIATNNDTAYQTLFDLRRQGISVAAVVDSRAEISPALRQQAEELGTEILTGARVSDTRGTKAVREIRVKTMNGKDIGRKSCDLLAVSGGWSPRVHLFCHARGSLKFDSASQCFLPDRLPSSFDVVGSAAGTAGLADTLSQAAHTSASICRKLGMEAKPAVLPEVTQTIVESSAVHAIPLETGKQRQWIDLAHDVTVSDAELAVREGFVSVEHFKRYTTTGMSVDQGKTGNLNAFIALGSLTGRETGEVGTTTFRPPYMPVTLGALAGRTLGEFYHPRRYLPAHALHEHLGAYFDDYGWQRPDCYPMEGESHSDAINREALAVRAGVGIFDNSPIGKIEVKGPDAAEFLNFIYMNNALTLKTGKARYGLMLNENGIIIDDGVFVRLEDDLFLVHTTSGGVGRIASMLEEWLQCELTQMQVVVDDMTAQWANFTIAGPRARDVLSRLGTDIDISAEAMPHMSAARGKVWNLDARIVRVSFSGELSFEVNIPASQATRFMEAVLEVGKEFGIVPYGVETLMLLRTEKGYLHVGSDTDGSTMPDDVGWGHVARNKTVDYVGKRSLLRSGCQDEDRMQFVGLELAEPNQEILPGAHLLIGEGREPPAVTDGWVTSAWYSPNLERYIALAVVKGGRSLTGEIVTVCDEEERFLAKIASPTFYDPENLRLKD